MPGEIVGLLAPNGFGKTILLHTLAGLIQPASGDIFICEENIKLISPISLAKKRAILLQNTNCHFPRSVFDFCLSGRYPHKNSLLKKQKNHDQQLVRESLAVMELSDKVTQNIQTLSGGELRRLAISTALAQTPKLLLLDEPLNHLDPRQQINLFSHLKKISHEHGVGVLMTLHDPFILRNQCSKILLPTADGNFLQGKSNEIITLKNLSNLYNIPLQMIKEHLCQAEF